MFMSVTDRHTQSQPRLRNSVTELNVATAHWRRNAANAHLAAQLAAAAEGHAAAGRGRERARAFIAELASCALAAAAPAERNAAAGCSRRQSSRRRSIRRPVPGTGRAAIMMAFAANSQPGACSTSQPHIPVEQNSDGGEEHGDIPTGDSIVFSCLACDITEVS